MQNPKEERITDVLGDRNRTDPDTIKAFQELIDSGIPRIPEHVFVKNLLPLSYKEEGVEKNPYAWRYATGSMSNGVHVIDPTGQILFTCPGLFPELPLTRERGKELHWAELARDAVDENNRHPGLGEERLAAIGLQHLPDASPDQIASHRDQWIAVWQRYGVNGYAQGDAPSVAVSKPAGSGELVEEEDDDEA